MTISSILGVVGAVLVVWSFVPYIQHILKKTIEPHIYTWFIWSVTHAIAALAIFEGDGGVFAATAVAAGGVLSFIIFILSLKHGSKNITTFDTVTLVTALAAIFMWWQLDHPEWAIITISLIDLLGFVPTLRKTWKKPKSEPVGPWVLYALGNIAAFFALTIYTVMTSFYIIAMIIASSALVAVIMYRKRAF